MKRLPPVLLAIATLLCSTVLTLAADHTSSSLIPGPSLPGEDVSSVGPGAGQPQVTLDAIWSNAEAHPGDQRTLAVIATLPAGYHINPDQPQLPANIDFLPIPASLTAKFVTSNPLTIGPIQYPPAEKRSVAYAKKPLPVFQGRFVMYVPILVPADARPGKFDLNVKLSYQMCSDQTCFPPASVSKTFTLRVLAMNQSLAAANPAANTKQLFAQFDPSVFAAMAKGPIGKSAASALSPDAARLHDDFFGYTFSLSADTPLGLSLIWLTALVAGLLLNFTPCVLPVVPLKIMALHQHAADPAGRIRQGLIFSAGIVATFLLLGALVAGLIAGVDQLQWGEIFAYPAVSISLAVIIMAMALSMLGVYSLRLPKAVYMFNPSYDTALGNFALGVLTAVLSTPCTGPMMGAAVAWSVKQSAGVSLSTFAIMGVGMALPYLLLTLKPGWLKHLPRTGPASELIKQVMGILLIAVAIFFLGSIIPGDARWWLIAAVIVVAMTWLLTRTFAITSRPAVRAAAVTVAAIVIFAGAAGGWLLTRPVPIHWQPFSDRAFAAARAAGQTVLVEYTADWCGNCKLLEATTYRDPRLKSLFDQARYTAFRIDLTRKDNQVGWTRLRDISSAGGIPLAVVYRPGSKAPSQVLSGLFSSNQLLDALRGTDAQ